MLKWLVSSHTLCNDDSLECLHSFYDNYGSVGDWSVVVIDLKNLIWFLRCSSDTALTNLCSLRCLPFRPPCHERRNPFLQPLCRGPWDHRGGCRPRHAHSNWNHQSVHQWNQTAYASYRTTAVEADNFVVTTYRDLLIQFVKLQSLCYFRIDRSLFRKRFRLPIGSHVVGAFIMPCGNCFYCVKV